MLAYLGVGLGVSIACELVAERENSGLGRFAFTLMWPAVIIAVLVAAAIGYVSDRMQSKRV
jgi:membrane protein required for beta-lactamase induction